MKRVWIVVSAVLILGCSDHGAEPTASGAKQIASLAEARRGFSTTLVRKTAMGEPALEPPPHLFRLVKYHAPGGELAAYVSVPPKDAKKRPAIIWLFGGFSNSIGDTAWKSAPAENDQSARAFREAGIIMMYPSLRGGNDNPGFVEAFYGEVDDVLAALDYLAKLDFVDPDRIYLGGHSTGGTLALLVAESTNRLRAVVAFGPASDVNGYGADHLPCAMNQKELDLRSPGKWLDSIQVPVFVFEGTRKPSNIGALTVMSRACRNPNVHFFPVDGATHFSILAPVTKLVAQKILRDDGSTCKLSFEKNELNETLGH